MKKVDVLNCDPTKINTDRTVMFRTLGNMSFKLALVQMSVGSSKPDNVSRAARLIKDAASNGAKVVVLPECFNSPYGTSYFPEYAESIPGPSTDALRKSAQENNIYLIGGSIPEKNGDKIYNTCTVFDPDGKLVGTHRKMHLFNIDIPGKIRFQESETLSPGKDFTMVDTPYCKIGVGICYDIRFAELAQVYARNDCKLLIYPGAFNMTTGPAHWELLQRARAVDNQVYVAAVSPARDEKANYVAWGHSTCVNPWGDVIATTEHSEDIVYVDIDLQRLEEVRSQVPVTVQRRNDLYDVIQK